MSVALSLAIGVLVGSAFLPSGPPSVGQKTTSQQQQPTQETQTPQAPTERGSAAAPIVVSKTAEDAKADEKARDEDSKNRWVNSSVALFTLLILYFQWGVMDTQNKIMKRQSTIMKRQHRTAVAQAAHMSEALEETRKAAIATSEHMTSQLGVAKTSADAAKRSADVAERALVVAERAYIDIGFWEVTDLEVGKSPKVQYKLSNSGRTPARLIRSRKEFAMHTPIPPPDPIGGVDMVEGGITISAGHKYGIFTTMNPPVTEAVLSGINSGAIKFWFRGQFWYLDGFEHERTMTFCVSYNLGLKTMTPVTEPGYHYAD